MNHLKVEHEEKCQPLKRFAQEGKRHFLLNLNLSIVIFKKRKVNRGRNKKGENQEG